MIPDDTSAALDAEDGEAIAEAVRETLWRKGLTLYRLAALSRARYPRQTAYHIHRNFYYQLRSGLSPTFQQVLALAEITDSRRWDWLQIFGFSLGNIPRLQAILARPRTTLVDDHLVDRESLLPFLRYRRPEAWFRGATPLSQLLERSGSYIASDLITPARGDFVYAKIGTGDALAFPELLPGSIVRADSRLIGSVLPGPSGQRSRPFFLVEHSRGLNCGRLRVSGPNHVAFVTSSASLASVDLRLGTETRILGVVDLELRFPPWGKRGAIDVAKRISSDVAEPWTSTRIAVRAGRRPAALLMTARLHAGLSFRSASALSHTIATILGDDRYFTSPGTLSDYEASDKLPRHIHKLFTLSIIYSVSFRDLLRSFAIAFDDFRTVATTQETSVPGGRTHRTRDNGFFEKLQNDFGHLPLFLASALPSLSGLAHISLRDVFWLGGISNPLHPSLRGAFLVLVNRRSKKPRAVSQMSVWAQPLYLLQERDGTYLAASCAMEKGRLAVYAYPQSSTEGQTVRRHIDADVVGQIVGVARSLVSPP